MIRLDLVKFLESSIMLGKSVSLSMAKRIQRYLQVFMIVLVLCAILINRHCDLFAYKKTHITRPIKMFDG